MNTILTQPDIAKVMSYSNQRVLQRYLQEHDVSYPDAEAIFHELLKFFCAARERRGQMSVPSGTIDDMWHSFLVRTKDYREFCKEYIGVFLDHLPNDEDRSLEQEYQDTRLKVIDMFGPVDSAIWPTEQTCGQRCCCSYC